MAADAEEIREDGGNIFNREAMGTWGTFTTAAGTVPYLMTSARLSRPNNAGGAAAFDSEARLMQELLPVREAVPLLPDEDFAFLVQRPLDDHRVVGQLIPYILQEPGNHPTRVPSFFPSILVAALPFNGEQPAPDFEGTLHDSIHERDTFFPATRYLSETMEGYFRFARSVNAEGALRFPRLAKFAWVPETMRLVILDGQHRAMALLAIQRQINQHWPDIAAEYRDFYSQVVVPAEMPVEDIRIPVTLVWFPPVHGVGQQPLATARSLFVTVNNQARAVGPARLMLLDDGDLKNIFTRALLERMRDEDAPEELRMLSSVLFEDDDYGGNRARSRWPKLTDHLVLGRAVQLTLWNSRSTTMVRTLQRTPHYNDATFRERLAVERDFGTFEDPITGENFESGTLTDMHFPEEWVPGLRTAFINSYGDAVLWLFSKVGPFKSHLQATEWLQGQEDLWDGPAGRLAFKAIFEANGLWQVVNRFNQQRGNIAQPPQVAAALQKLDSAEARYMERWTHLYLGNDPDAPGLPALTDPVRQRARDMHLVLRTEACQVGLVGLLMVLLKEVVKRPDEVSIPRDYVAPFGQRLAESLAISLEGAGDAQGAAGERRWALGPGWEGTLTFNQIGDLEPNVAHLFRYMWLELLRAEHARTHLEEWLRNFRGWPYDEEVSLELKLGELARNGRSAYLSRVQRELLPGFIAQHPQEQAEAQAMEQARLRLNTVLMNFIGVQLPADNPADAAGAAPGDEVGEGDEDGGDV